MKLPKINSETAIGVGIMVLGLAQTILTKKQHHAELEGLKKEIAEDVIKTVSESK